MPIPSQRLCQANWQASGMRAEGGIPARTTIYTTLDAATYGHGATTINTALTSAIGTAPLGTTIKLGAGNFSVDAALLVNRGITIRGAGRGATRVRMVPGASFNVNPPSNIPPIFRVAPSAFSAFDNTTGKFATADAVRGTSTVTLNNVTGLSVGQFVEIAEDQYFTGSWLSKPNSSEGISGNFADAVANQYQIWAGDRIAWKRHRKIASIAISSSSATTNEFTTSAAHGLSVGAIIAIENHSGIVCTPAYREGQFYTVMSTPTSTTLTLRTKAYNGVGETDVDVTTGGTGGAFRQNRGGDDFYPGETLANDANSPLRWFSTGDGYYYGEVKEIASISGNTLTFTSPFTDTYRVSHNARVAWSTTAHVVGIGIEDMTILGGGTGGIAFAHAAKSWAKNVEVADWYGHGIGISGCHRIEVLGCDIHDGTWPTPGGGGYALALNFNSAECLIWNSRTYNTNKNIVAQGGGAGSVVAYNTFDNAFVSYDLSWQEVGANASHMAGPHHVLFEGNDATNFDSDDTHGTSYEITVFRNRLRGSRRHYSGMANARCLGLGSFSKNFSFAGNVLGVSGAMSGWAAAPTTTWSGSFVRKFGYDPIEWGIVPDDASLNIVDFQNYSHLTSSANAPESIADSLFLSAAPEWWPSGMAWPPYNASTGAVIDIPSRLAFLHTGSLDGLVTYESVTGGGGGGGGGGVAFVGQESNSAESASPAVTYTATAGNLLVVSVHINIGSNDRTCATPSGWTLLSSALSTGTARQYTFARIAAGGDALSFPLSGSAWWALGVMEFSGATAALRTFAARTQDNSAPTTGNTPAASVSGDVAVSVLSLHFSTAAASGSGYVDGPEGYYGTAFGMKGHQAYKLVTTGAVENASWTVADSADRPVAVYVFEAAAASGGARKRNRHAGDRGSRRGERRGGTQ